MVVHLCRCFSSLTVSAKGDYFQNCMVYKAHGPQPTLRILRTPKSLTFDGFTRRRKFIVCSLMAYGTMQPGKWVETFRRNVLRPSSGLRDHKYTEYESRIYSYFEMLIPTYHTKLCRDPENDSINIQQYLYY